MRRLVGLTGAADAKEPQDCYEAKPRKIVHLIFASKDYRKVL